jgi:hypothetical protein
MLLGMRVLILRLVVAVMVSSSIAGCDGWYADGDDCFRDVNACSPSP